MDKDLLAKAKSLGFSDRQIAHLTQRTESEVRAERNALGLMPGFRLVDTCAAEFEAYTPYYYSSYDQGDDEVRPSDLALANKSLSIFKKTRRTPGKTPQSNPQSWGSCLLYTSPSPRDS